MMIFPLLFSALAFTAQASKHHFFVGSYGTPSIYGLEFDNVANSLSVTKNNTTRKENEWLALSHDAKTLYSSGADGWSSFPVTSNTTLGAQSPSTPGSGNCGAWNGVYVMASRKAPYPLYGSLNCANWVSTGPEGEVGKATALPYNEVSVIYGMATDPTYSYLYSSDWRNGKIWTHKVGSDGSLTLVGFTESPSNASAPRTLQVHPSGKSMYVILEAWNAMALYFINETTHMPYYTNALYPLVPPGLSPPSAHFKFSLLTSFRHRRRELRRTIRRSLGEGLHDLGHIPLPRSWSARLPLWLLPPRRWSSLGLSLSDQDTEQWWQESECGGKPVQ